MSLYDLPNSTSGLDAIVVDTVSAVPGFTPLILTFVFFTVWLGGMARQKARTGSADYAMWSVVASLTTFMTTLIMTLISGFINLEILVIVVVVTIFSGVWFFLSQRQSEI